MKYVDTIFSLLGTSSVWNIKVPVCGCTAESRDRRSNGNDTVSGVSESLY